MLYDPAEQEEIAKAPPEEDTGAVMRWAMTRIVLIAAVILIMMIAGQAMQAQ